MQFKTATKIVLAASILIGVARFCHHQTRGFAMGKIRGNLVRAPSIELPANREAEEVLCQKFYYFNRGKQSYAFLSEDGKYVLKLFNNNYQHKLQWLEAAQVLPFLRAWAFLRASYYQRKLDKTFESYALAFKQMPEQTALCYAHLAPTTHLPKELTLIDPLNIAHTLDLNTTGFLLQKRVDLVYPFLKEKIKSGNLQEAEEAISSLINLFFWKYRHSIGDNDPLIRTNYGFLAGKAIQIDVGPLSIDNSLTAKELQENEARRTTASLKHWLEENCPELIPFLDRELESQLSWRDEKAPDLPFYPRAADRIATAD